ncbi:MAG: DUF4129 domain-containing protein [Kineosporiaceae bacterium]
MPVQPDAAQGRAWARAELARPGYDHPGLVRRALAWLLERVADLPLPHGTGSALTGAALLVALAAVVAWAVRQAGSPLASGRRPTGDVFADAVLTAADHRAAADRAAAAGDLRTAVLERFRAAVRELEERAIVAEQPGRTAGEAAAAAAAQLPELAGALAAAARTFDDVRYGGRPATSAMDAALRELDARLRAQRPAATGVRP